VKLYTNPSSPFGRKAVIAAIELGQFDAMDIIDINPWESTAELLAANPLSKIPALVTDHGETVFNSPAVCDYLNALDGKHRLLPLDAGKRATSLRRQSLADGMLDSAIVIMLNRQQKPERVHRGYVARQEATIARSLDLLENEAPRLHDGFDLGHIALICALDFLTIAKVADWESEHPALSAWLGAMRQRPSVKRTHPPPPGM
jgi:glutathione S-transferase